jgi:hypothetical protein
MDIIKVLKENGFIKEDADETVIQSKVDEYIEGEVVDRTSGLIKNRDDLKNEKLQLSQQFNDFKSQYSFVTENDLSAESFADLKNQLETYRAKGGSDEEIEKKLTENYERGKKAKEDELTPTLTKLQKEMEAEKEGRETAVKQYQDYRAESEIRKAVNQAGLKVDDIWFNGLKQNASIEMNDAGQMMISLPYEGGLLPIGDWVKSFPATEAGKRLLPPKLDMGGNGFGGSGGSSDNESEVDRLNKMFNF